MNKTYVLKFGGSSVETTEKIANIAQRLCFRQQQGERLVVVVSAMGQTTNNLVSLAKEIQVLPNGRDMDLLMSTGEQVSIALMSMAIKEHGCKAVALTGFQAGIETDSVHTKARIEKIDSDRISEHLDQGQIVVVAGFQGTNSVGEITTLGRGGSDTTAVSLAAVLECPCEIYTDVEGVYTVDPRIFPSARKLNSISYEEMLEMASRGANVLETRSVEMGHKYKVPILVGLNSMDKPGTLIKELDESMEKNVVTGLSVDENVLMISMNMVPYASKNVALIFSKLASENIYVDMISQTAPYNSFVNISFTTRADERHHVKKVMDELLKLFPTVDLLLDTGMIKVSVVGVGMVSQSGVAARLFDIFADNEVDFFQVTTSEISISYTVNHYDRDKIVGLIASEFGL